eukprot:194962_1
MSHLDQLDVCIGDDVLLTNHLVGTVEFIGQIHDYNENDQINDDVNANETNEDEDIAIDDNKYEDPIITYGILINVAKYTTYPSCLDRERESNFGKINNVQRIPIELFNTDGNDKETQIESLFVSITEIKYVNRRKHNFRIKMNDEYVIPRALGTLYSGCRTKLQYAGYFASHKRKTNDSVHNYKEYMALNGLLQNYYLGFMVNKECKHMIHWNWDSPHQTNRRLCRLYPEDSRRYMNHTFAASLDGIQPHANDDIVLFVNLHELLHKRNTRSNDSHLFQFRQLVALYFNEMKQLPALYPNETLSFMTLVESILLRHWKCISYEDNVLDINWIIIDYIKIHLRDPVLMEESSIITQLYQTRFIHELCTRFVHCTVLDNVTLRELIYKNENGLLFPWVEGHVFDTKLWLKTQWNRNDGYRAIIPAFRSKFQCNTNTNDFKSGIHWRCGIRKNELIIIYRFKTITIFVLWKADVIDANKRGFSAALQNVQLRRVTSTKAHKKHEKNTTKRRKRDSNDEAIDKFPTQRHQIFRYCLERIFKPMSEHFENNL